MAEYQTGFELAHRHRRLGVGAMDLLHVASALHLQKAAGGNALVVASSDHAFLALAQEVGLQTIDPETASLQLLLGLAR